MTHHYDPAYLISEDNWGSGLSKREAFAMAAMQGYCANPSMGTESGTLTVSDAKIAAWSVDMADALIAALNQEKP